MGGLIQPPPVENRVKCSIINKLLQLMIRTLKKARCLANGCVIDMFLFTEYPVNSIENITLMFTWKHIYNSKFSCNPLTEKLYMHTYKGLITVIIQMSIPISLIAENIIHILSNELDHKTANKNRLLKTINIVI